MAAEDIEIVRSLHAPESADLVALFGDDDAWAALRASIADRFEPEFGCAAFGAAYDRSEVGFDGLRELWRDWLAPWERYRSTIERASEVGDRILVEVVDHGVPRGASAEIELRAASVWTVRDGRVARVEFHVDRDSAVRAAKAAR